MKKLKKTKEIKYNFPIRQMLLNTRGLATLIGKEMGIGDACVHASTTGITKPHFNRMIRYKEAMEKITGKKYTIEDLFGKMF